MTVAYLLQPPSTMKSIRLQTLLSLTVCLLLGNPFALTREDRMIPLLFAGVRFTSAGTFSSLPPANPTGCQFCRLYSRWWADCTSDWFEGSDGRAEKRNAGRFRLGLWRCPFSHRASIQPSASISQLACLRLRLFDVNGAMKCP